MSNEKTKEPGKSNMHSSGFLLENWTGRKIFHLCQTCARRKEELDKVRASLKEY